MISWSHILGTYQFLRSEIGYQCLRSRSELESHILVWNGVRVSRNVPHTTTKNVCASCYISYQHGPHYKNSWNICDLICVALYIEFSYHALGYSASCLSHDFYIIPGLSHLLADNVVKSLRYVPNYRLRFVVRILWTWEKLQSSNNHLVADIIIVFNFVKRCHVLGMYFESPSLVKHVGKILHGYKKQTQRQWQRTFRMWLVVSSGENLFAFQSSVSPTECAWLSR